MSTSDRAGAGSTNAEIRVLLDDQSTGERLALLVPSSQSYVHTNLKPLKIFVFSFVIIIWYGNCKAL